MRRLIVLILCCLAGAAEAKSPKPAEPPAHQTGCEWAGQGYVKLAGTDTCVKVSGSVRGEFSSSK